ncbi:MAG: hypothetical protein ACRER5_02870 [Pseudomonas sp.]
MTLSTSLKTLLFISGALSFAMVSLAVAAAPQSDEVLCDPAACEMDEQDVRHQALVKYAHETVALAFAGIQTRAYGRVLRMREAAADCGDLALSRELRANAEWRRAELIRINTGGLVDHGEQPLAASIFESLENATAAGYTQAMRLMIEMDPEKKEPFCETSLAIGRKVLGEPLDVY